jgi:hypothetical protein
MAPDGAFSSSWTPRLPRSPYLSPAPRDNSRSAYRVPRSPRRIPQDFAHLNTVPDGTGVAIREFDRRLSSVMTAVIGAVTVAN